MGIGNRDALNSVTPTSSNVGTTLYDYVYTLGYTGVTLWHSRLDSDYNTTAIPASHAIRSRLLSNGIGASSTNPLNDYSIEITEFLADSYPSRPTQFYPVVGRKQRRVSEAVY